MFKTEVLINIKKRRYKGYEYFLAEVQGLPEKLYAYTTANPFIHVNGKKSDPADVKFRIQRQFDNYIEMKRQEGLKRKPQ